MTIFKDGAYYPLGIPEEMSEGEYQAMCDDDAYTSSISLNEKSHYWRTRDGRVLKIAEMSTDHLGNAIELFTRSGLGEHPKIRELRNERSRR